VVTFSTRRSLPHRQYSTREGKAGDEEINAVGLVGFRSWRKTGATRFPFTMESCPQNEHRNWSDKILFRHGILSTERTQKLERHDSLSSWNLVHRKNTETEATRFSFATESCPQKANRNCSDKILFQHEILSTETKQKLKRQDSLSAWSFVHRTKTEIAPDVFTRSDGAVYFTTVTPAFDYLQYQHPAPFTSLQYRQAHCTSTVFLVSFCNRNICVYVCSQNGNQTSASKI
jgi:hypothetical protein